MGAGYDIEGMLCMIEIARAAASYKSDGILSIKADVGCRSGPLSAGPGVPVADPATGTSRSAKSLAMPSLGGGRPYRADGGE